MTGRPTLSLVVCGAPLTRRAGDLAVALLAAGWDVTVLATDAARGWLDERTVATLTGRPVVSAFRTSDQPRAPRPDVVVVAPLTFHTGNSLRLGLADTQPRAALCEALGARTPLVVVPFVNDRLAGHPAWPATIHWLLDAGATLLDPATGQAGGAGAVRSGTGEQLADRFNPGWITRELSAQRSRLRVDR